MQTYII